MADAQSAPDPSSQYRTAAESIRKAAQWLIGAFAAVGAAMLAGLQLIGLGELEGADLFWAIIAVVAAITGVTIAIVFCARVLAPKTLTISDAADDPRLG